MEKKIKVTCRGALNVALEKLHPLQDELKRLSDESYEKLRRSLLKHGFSFPFFAWRNRGKLWILDGHQRDIALRRLKSEGYQVPALPVALVDARNKKEAKEKILLISSQYGLMTEEGLVKFIKDASLDVDELMQLVDIHGIDLGKLFAGDTPEAPEPKIDQAKQLQKKYGTALGQIWTVGVHRLMCGDSRKTELIRTLIGDDRPTVLTDPPYGISIVNKSKIGGGGATKFGKIGGGDWVNSNIYSQIIGDETTQTAKAFVQSARELGLENYILWGGNYFTDFLKPSRCWIVWDKRNTGNFADVELAWTSFDRGACLYSWLWNGLSREGSRAEELTSRIHPTQKPVGLFKKIISDFPADSYFDGFLGSGTTMVAAQQLGRVCYGMELDPGYVAVTLERMADMGLKPQLEGKSANVRPVAAAANRKKRGQKAGVAA